MCGIIAHLGNQNVTEILLNGLERMESRGYDSTGIAVIDQNNKIQVKKFCGELNTLKKHLETNHLYGRIGIGHNRWATSGSDINDANAHPHFSENRDIALVHNGIIENHHSLKNQLLAKGHIFNSETDSEVIVHLIEEHYRGELLPAVKKACDQLQGSFALAIIHNNDTNQIVVAKKESPLVLALGENAAFVASQSSAISKYSQEHYYMQDNEFAILRRSSLELFDHNLKPLTPDFKIVSDNEEDMDKKGFEYFMEKEIFEQSPKLLHLLKKKSDANSVKLDEVKLSLEEIRQISRLQIIACGSSWHAALLGKNLMEKLLRLPVEVEVASEFRYKDPIILPNDLLIFISQSGETADTLASLKEAKSRGAKTLSIVNVKNSNISRHSDMVIYTEAGLEIGVASTKAFTAQVLAMYLLTIYLGEKQNKLDEKYRATFLQKLRQTLEQIPQILKGEKEINSALKYFRNIHSALFISRGINTAIAREAALKTKELAYISTEAYPSGEMKHGPIALIDEHCPIVAIATNSEHYIKTINNIEEVQSRGGRIICLASADNKNIKKLCDCIIEIPVCDELFSPLLNTVAIQILSFKIAKDHGRNVDKPRNLAKSVTVE